MARNTLPEDTPSRLLGVTKNPSQEAPHRRHARAWREAGYGQMAEVSRLTGIHERVLQEYMGHQNATESPSERTERMILALRQVDSPDADLPLRVLADALGYDLAPRHEGDDEHGCMLESLGEMVDRFGDSLKATRATIDPTSDGGRSVTPRELEELRGPLQGLIEEAHRLLRTAEASSNVSPMARARG